MFNQMSVIVAGLIVPVLVVLVSRPNIAPNTRRLIALVVSIVVYTCNVSEAIAWLNPL